MNEVFSNFRYNILNLLFVMKYLKIKIVIDGWFFDKEWYFEMIWLNMVIDLLNILKLNVF